MKRIAEEGGEGSSLPLPLPPHADCFLGGRTVGRRSMTAPAARRARRAATRAFHGVRGALPCSGPPCRSARDVMRRKGEGCADESSSPSSRSLLCAPVPDKSGFGFRMLEKMGWSEGKGLGAKEDGTATHIRVKKRADNLGASAGSEDGAHCRRQCASRRSCSCRPPSLQRSARRTTSRATPRSPAPCKTTTRCWRACRPLVRAGTRVGGEQNTVARRFAVCYGSCWPHRVASCLIAPHWIAARRIGSCRAGGGVRRKGDLW